jgi:hypothetical protein
MDEIRRQVEQYDAECARGITHDRGYAIKMEQYRLSLS